MFYIIKDKIAPMIKNKIENYIKNIPAIPKNVKECALYLQEGDLHNAAKSALQDPAFSHYLITLVNKPIFGFRNEIKDISQIFGILGVEKAAQVVNAYYAKLILPKAWKLFPITNSDFQALQAALISNWNKILDYEHQNKISLASVVSLLPASIIVCEEIFEDNLEDVKLLKLQKDLSYDEILFKISGYKLFDIFIIICQKWELPQESIKFIEYISKKIEDDSVLSKLARYIHLLMFFELSKPIYVKAGLNDFVEFDVEFVQDVYENFTKIVESL